MTTRTPGGPGEPDASGSAPPGELRPHQGYVPNPADTPGVPSALATTPGVSQATVRHPGAPTLPDFDPVAMSMLVAQAANELFASPPADSAGPAAVPPAEAPPPGVSPAGELPLHGAGAGPAAALPSAGSGSAPVTALPSPNAGSAPALAPTTPNVGPLPSPGIASGAPALPSPSAPRGNPGLGGAATSPFDLPPNFDAIALADPVAQMLGAGVFTFPLLSVLPGEAPPAPAPAPAFVVPGYEIAPVIDLPIQRLAGTPFDPHAIKREFPILAETVNGRPLVWLDNAATTQKPWAVIERLSYFYEHENSNIHRAAHTLAARATEAYESARESVRRFVNASSTSEIVFVRGATEGINLVAQSWGRRNVEAGDEIVVTWLEHHANIVPWQQLCLERGARLRVAPVDDRGQVILEEYEKILGPKTRLVAFTQVSNAIGTVTPVREMVEIAHRYGARVLVDGAQAVSHMRVDVQAIDCDFYVFSGHKVFAPTGIGVVYGLRDLLAAMPPWQGGGNMIQDVTFERSTYQGPPARFEAGTGNIADAVGLGAALDWLSRVGLEAVAGYEHELLAYATECLKTVPGLTLIGTAPDKAGVLSFVLAGQKTEEVGGLLDREGIAVRSGHHCAQPILRRFGLESTVRASLAPYNTREDIDALVAALQRLQAGHATRR